MANFTLDAYVDQHISCNGNADGYIQANVTPAGNYEITCKKSGQLPTSNASGFFKPLVPGTYKVVAKDLNTGETLSTKLKVTQPAKLKVKFVAETNPTTANPTGGSISLTITGGAPILQPYLVTWKNSAGVTLNSEMDNFATYLENLPADTYTVTIEDDNGCFLTKSYKLKKA